jgi:Na+-driven multidrug efflux pump
MCTVLVPPPLAPAWPWQAPGNWLAFAVGCAVGIVGVRRQTDARRRRIGWVLLLAMTLCLIVGLLLILIVIYPAIDALNNWESQQDQAVRAQGCSAAA